MVFFGVYGGYILDFLHLPVKEMLHHSMEVNAKCRPSCMVVLLTVLPLLNMLLLVTVSRFVPRTLVLPMVISSMFAALFVLLCMFPGVVEGDLVTVNAET